MNSRSDLNELGILIPVYFGHLDRLHSLLKNIQKLKDPTVKKQIYLIFKDQNDLKKCVEKVPRLRLIFDDTQMLNFSNILMDAGYKNINLFIFLICSIAYE